MVVDFHVHCFPGTIAERAVLSLSERAGIPARSSGEVNDIKKSMQKAGIDRSVILSIATKPTQTENINNWAAEIQDNEIIAFGSIHPEYSGWREEIKRIKRLGLKGIKLHPEYQSFYVDVPEMLPIYQYAFELGLIVVLHAGVDLGMPTPYHCTPERLLKLVEHFPEGKFVAAHMGGYRYWDEVERLLIGKNIYLDTSYTLGHTDNERIKRMINNHDYRKILFASDSPWMDQNEEVAKLKALELGLDAERSVLGENAKNLLGLEDN